MLLHNVRQVVYLRIPKPYKCLTPWPYPSKFQKGDRSDEPLKQALDPHSTANNVLNSPSIAASERHMKGISSQAFHHRRRSIAMALIISTKITHSTTSACPTWRYDAISSWVARKSWFPMFVETQRTMYRGWASTTYWYQVYLSEQVCNIPAQFSVVSVINNECKHTQDMQKTDKLAGTPAGLAYIKP